MACKWDKRITLAQRVAAIVPSATAGAVNKLFELSVLTLPSPRLQAMIGFPNTPQPAGSFWSWLDAGNATAHGADSPATWNISPIIEAPARDLPLASLYQDVTALGDYLNGPGVFGNASAPMSNVSDTEANAYPWFSPGYLIGGESARRWLIAATLRFYGSSVVSSFASLVAEITPAAGVDMSLEEWNYWIDKCQLQSLTSNDGNPPLLKSV